MPIAFKDFAPEVTKHAGIFRPATYEQLQQTVDRANAWIKAEGISLMSIETVVLPNIHSPREEGTTDPDLHATGINGAANHWNQFIRVWYQA